jgi:tetratricopeptide (TPR) repeat protein
MLDEFQRDEALIHFQRGLVLERAHRVQEAVEEYRRAIVHNPHLREAHGALGSYYQRHGLLAKAAEEFRVVASLNDDFLSHFNLGYLLLELERYDEAQLAFQRCLVLAPDDPATHYELGYIAYLRNDYSTALDQLQRPLRYYPDDWETHHLIGRCHLRLANYDAAQEAFGKALRAASSTTAQIEMARSLQMVERYREIGLPRSAKDLLYAEHGVVCLGSAQDDGLDFADAQDYHFTFPDIGTTLQRLLELATQGRWAFTCVVALDRLAHPLAAALTGMLALPLRHADEVGADEVSLLVLAIGREAELLELALERIPGESVTFCLGLNWLRHRPLLPEITGVIARGACSVPWEPELRRLRSDGAPHDQIELCLTHATEQIVAAVRETPRDANLAEQVRYYTEQHTYLRFVETFEPLYQ